MAVKSRAILGHFEGGFRVQNQATLMGHPAFVCLREICRDGYPNAGSRPIVGVVVCFAWMRSPCEAAVDLRVSVRIARVELSEATRTTSAWLAVDRRQQGKGSGRFLLADALYRAAQSEIASLAVFVDAKDEGAGRFYEQESFLPLDGTASPRKACSSRGVDS